MIHLTHCGAHVDEPSGKAELRVQWTEDGRDYGMNRANLTLEAARYLASRLNRAADTDNALASLVARSEQSLPWIAKLIADRPEPDTSGIREQAERHTKRLQEAISGAKRALAEAPPQGGEKP